MTALCRYSKRGWAIGKFVNALKRPENRISPLSEAHHFLFARRYIAQNRKYRVWCAAISFNPWRRQLYTSYGSINWLTWCLKTENKPKIMPTISIWLLSAKVLPTGKLTLLSKWWMSAANIWPQLSAGRNGCLSVADTGRAKQKLGFRGWYFDDFVIATFHWFIITDKTQQTLIYLIAFAVSKADKRTLDFAVSWTISEECTPLAFISQTAQISTCIILMGATGARLKPAGYE